MTYPDAYAPRVTAYRYVWEHGLMDRFGAIETLFEVGRRAAGEAHWLGLEPQYVLEGPPEAPFWVHTWPESLWSRVIATLEREEKTVFADTAVSQDDAGWDAGWPPQDEG